MTRPYWSVNDTEALDQIHGIMSGKEWSSETLEAIAEVVESTGRLIAEPNARRPGFDDTAWEDE